MFTWMATIYILIFNAEDAVSSKASYEMCKSINNED